MIAQAIVALLQQASEIDWVTVRSCFLYRAAADNSFSGFRLLLFHAAEQSGGPKLLPFNLWPPYRRGRQMEIRARFAALSRRRAARRSQWAFSNAKMRAFV
jgi:hypothetical protein